MKFSIVTPTRNALEKLRRCVGSVRGQSGVAVRHIVQDACSSDGTPAWLAAQPDLDWRSEADGGMYDAINRGWARADGEILSWLNSDEQYLPGTLEKVAQIFTNSPEIDFIYGNYIVVKPDGDPIAARREIRLSMAYISNGYLNAASCTMFFRRRLLEARAIHLDTGFRYASDMDMVLRLLSAGYKPKFIKQYLALFAFDGGNLSCSPEMIEETLKIRKKFGGKYGLLRLPYMGLRVIERAISGSYKREDVSYLYAIDDSPRYRAVDSKAVSASYVTQ